MDKSEHLIPWQINQTLSAQEAETVAQWLKDEPEAATRYQAVQELSQAVCAQEVQSPAVQVRDQLFVRVRQHSPQPRINIQYWLWGGPIMLLLFGLLWFIVQPGTALQWSTNGNAAAAFRIYRAPVGSGQFELIEEISATPSLQTYEYADLQVLPGINYQYIIEAHDQTGHTTFSQAAMSDSLMTLVAQIAILLTSFMLTFGMITIVQEVKAVPSNRLPI